jgi:hypothetical protein
MVFQKYNINIDDWSSVTDGLNVFEKQRSTKTKINNQHWVSWSTDIRLSQAI